MISSSKGRPQQLVVVFRILEGLELGLGDLQGFCRFQCVRRTLVVAVCSSQSPGALRLLQVPSAKPRILISCFKGSVPIRHSIFGKF